MSAVRRQLVAVAVVGACVLGLAAAPGSAADSVSVTNLGSGSPQSTNALASDDAGNAVSLVSEGEGGGPLDFRYYHAGGSWSAAYPLTAAPTYRFGAASGRAGTALAYWIQSAPLGYNPIMVRTRRPNATWAPAVKLNNGGAVVLPQAVENADGDMAVAWLQKPTGAVGGPDTNYTAYVAIFLRGDRWRTFAVGPSMGEIPDLRMDGSGTVYVARSYARSDSPGTYDSSVLRVKRPGKAFGAATVIQEAGPTAQEFDFVVEPTGRQTWSFYRRTSSDDPRGTARVTRQERLGAPLVQVWSGPVASLPRVAAAGARLRLAWTTVTGDPSATDPTIAAQTQTIRPTVGPVTTVATTDAGVAVQALTDAFGNGAVSYQVGTGNSSSRAYFRRVTQTSVGPETRLATPPTDDYERAELAGPTANGALLFDLGGSYPEDGILGQDATRQQYVAHVLP